MAAGGRQGRAGVGRRAHVRAGWCSVPRGPPGRRAPAPRRGGGGGGGGGHQLQRFREHLQSGPRSDDGVRHALGAMRGLGGWGAQARGSSRVAEGRADGCLAHLRGRCVGAAVVQPARRRASQTPVLLSDLQDTVPPFQQVASLPPAFDVRVEVQAWQSGEGQEGGTGCSRRPTYLRRPALSQHQT